MKTKNCKNCNFFEKLYTTYVYGFSFSLAFRKYYCALNEQITERENVCDKWSIKITECDISPERFKEAEEDIKKLTEMLRQIF